MRINLSEKTALVSGASQGIGLATAKQLAASGARVIALARSRDKLEEMIAKLPGSNHTFIAGDLLDPGPICDQIKEQLAEHGPIEIFVANCGGPKAGPLTEAQPEDILNAVQAHIIATGRIFKLLQSGMIEKGYGRLIHVTSTSVRIPIANLGVSNLTRAAVASWSKTLANELGSKQITVNNVMPGFTETPRLAALIANAAKRQNCSEATIRENWQNQVPLKRFAQAAETAQLITFLASEAASYITGTSIPVDGGRTGAI